jgi:hypothetical protein
MKIPALPAICNHFTADVKFKIYSSESIGMLKRGGNIKCSELGEYRKFRRKSYRKKAETLNYMMLQLATNNHTD